MRGLVLLVNTKNRGLWEGLTPEDRDYSAHVHKIGFSQKSGFLVLSKRTAASRDENASTILFSRLVLDYSLGNSEESEDSLEKKRRT